MIIYESALPDPEREHSERLKAPTISVCKHFKREKLFSFPFNLGPVAIINSLYTVKWLIFLVHQARLTTVYELTGNH
jgi:hypothetical protein